MLKGARQRLGGQLHREGESSTMKVKVLGLLGVRRWAVERVEKCLGWPYC